MEPPERAEGGSDRDLMVRLGVGDRDALAPLMARHYPRLYRIALAYVRNTDDALDVVQETFVRAYEHAARWDGRAEAGSWLTRIAVNLSIDRYRRVRRRLLTFSPLEETDRDDRQAAEAPSPERQAAGRELGKKIASALGALPERQRAVFVLRHYEEMSLEEIGDSLGMSLGTVKSSLHRAVHRLRQRLASLRP